jgi:hypothetical protein
VGFSDEKKYLNKQMLEISSDFPFKRKCFVCSGKGRVGGKGEGPVSVSDLEESRWVASTRCWYNI